MLIYTHAASALFQQGELTPTEQGMGLARAEEFTLEVSTSLYETIIA